MKKLKLTPEEADTILGLFQGMRASEYRLRFTLSTKLSDVVVQPALKVGDKIDYYDYYELKHKPACDHYAQWCDHPAMKKLRDFVAANPAH